MTFPRDRRDTHTRGCPAKSLYVYWFFSEDFSLLVAFLLVTFSWLFRGPLLSRKTVFGPFSLLFRGFFVAFSWLFRGPRFGQILRVLALEQSSDFFFPQKRALREP